MLWSLIGASRPNGLADFFFFFLLFFLSSATLSAPRWPFVVKKNSDWAEVRITLVDMLQVEVKNGLVEVIFH